MNNRRRIEIRRNRRKKEERRWRKGVIHFIQVTTERDIDAFFDQENVKVAAALGCRTLDARTRMIQAPIEKRREILAAFAGMQINPVLVAELGVTIAPKDYVDILGGCKACGTSVAFYLCNEQLQGVRMEAAAWDYWASCVNPTCRNHHGEGYFQALPDWIER